MFTIYKTTNLHNGKFYIGVHETENPTDSYLGSGRSILAAIKKYGKSSFRKEVLHLFEDMEEAYAKEAEIVTVNSIKDKDCYNEIPGGHIALAKVLRRPDVVERLRTHAKTNSIAIAKRQREESEFKALMDNNLRMARTKHHDTLRANPAKHQANKTKIAAAFTPELRQKMREATSGQNSRTYGARWINDGEENKYIRNGVCPSGWVYGRLRWLNECR
jgi:hypothetical protein